MLLLEASNSFFNPAEASVLAPQPIRGATLFAAKLTYLVVVVVRVEAALNGPPALAGLLKPEARWFYPITHMAAALLTGLFLALVACAVFGFLFRFLPASKVRSAALWLQLFVVMLPLLLNLVMPRVGDLLTSAPRDLSIDWSFLPVTWFSAIAVAGQAPPIVPLRWGAVIGLAVSSVFIAYGVHALSAGYLTRVVAAVRSSRRGRRVRARRPVFGALVRRLTGRPAGQAAFGFVSCMMRRDWQFRRAMAQSVVLLVFYVPAIVMGSRGPSPFAGGAPNVVGILPEAVPLVSLMACAVLAYSEHHRASWVFLLAPEPDVRAFVRGVYWTLWLPLLALPFGVGFLFFTWYWGLLDAALFVTYGLAVGSLFLALQFAFVDGLPFANQPRADRNNLFIPFVVFGPVAIGIGWVAQWYFLFHSRALVLAASLACAALAVPAARLTFGWLDVKVRRDLTRLAGGSAHMFGTRAVTPHCCSLMRGERPGGVAAEVQGREGWTLGSARIEARRRMRLVV